MSDLRWGPYLFAPNGALITSTSSTIPAGSYEAFGPFTFTADGLLLVWEG